MHTSVSSRRITWLLLCGLAGCLLMAGSDWLMIYGDTAYLGKLAWLTQGVAAIPAARNRLAMMLALPAVIFYALALLGIRHFLKARYARPYVLLTTLGLTPWLCLHLFYVMILYLFSWLTAQGQTALAHQAGEALFAQFSWLVLVSEVLMLLPFFYLLWLFATRRSIFPRLMALNNPLFYYILLKALTLVLPDVPARLAFVNGLMSESMLIWFLVFLFTFRSSLRQSDTVRG